MSASRAIAPRHLAGFSGAAGIIAGALLALPLPILLGILASVAAVVLYISSIILEWRQRKVRKGRSSTLTKTLVGVSEVRPILNSLAAKMELPAPWRISIYEVQDDMWHRLARRSSFPEYEGESGRKSFPVRGGCIGHALLTRAIDELPALPDPKTEFDAYVALHVSRDVERHAVEQFRMRSRSYAAVVYTIPYGSHEGTSVGVVAETIVPNGVLAARVARHCSIDVVTMLHQLIKIGPSVLEMHAVVSDAD